LLARGASRQQQTALRLALGAGRARLIRAVLTESLLLSLAGGAAGLILAYAGSKAILLLAFRGATYVPITASPSLPVLGFALLLSILTAIVFAVAPAWIGTRANPSDGLRTGSRGATHHASRPQKALVIVQAALSVVLLAVAGLVTQSLRNLEKTDLGFQPKGRLVATLNFKAAGYTPEQLPSIYQRVQERLEQIPGVRSASLSLNAPQQLCCISLNISIGGRPDNRLENIDTGFSRVSLITLKPSARRSYAAAPSTRTTRSPRPTSWSSMSPLRAPSSPAKMPSASTSAPRSRGMDSTMKSWA